MERPVREAAIVGVVLFAIATVIVLSFNVFGLGKSVAIDGSIKTQGVVVDFVNSDLSLYDDKVVTGRDIISVYKNNQSKGLAILISLNTFVSGGSLSSSDRVVFGVNDLIYVNYNAILSSDKDNNEVKKNVVYNYYADSNFDIKDGKVLTTSFVTLDNNGRLIVDGNVSDWSKKASKEYISVNSKFESNLIYDSTDVVIGIMFTQQK